MTAATGAWIALALILVGLALGVVIGILHKQDNERHRKGQP